MPWKSRFRTLHRWLALAASLPLIVVATTGAPLAFPEQTRRILAGDEPAGASSGAVQPPSALISAIEAALPEGERIGRLLYPVAPGHLLIGETEGYRVLVDPYSARVRRVTPADRDPVALITRIHVSLLAGEIGRWVTGLSAVALMLLCLSGLRLWWPVGRWRASYFLVKLTGGWKRANFDLHRASGLALGLPMLLMAATGATIAFWAVVTPAAYLLTWSAPNPGPELEVRPPADAEMISPDRALGVAMARYPGFEPRRLYPPAGPDRPYRVFLDPPGEHETRLNEARLEIDPYSGEVLFEEGPATMSRGDRLLRWVLPLHFGTFGGTATKLAYLVSCLGPALLAATGTALWWNRRRKAKAHRPRLPAEAEEEARSLQSA